MGGDMDIGVGGNGHLGALIGQDAHLSGEVSGAAAEGQGVLGIAAVSVDGVCKFRAFVGRYREAAAGLRKGRSDRLVAVAELNAVSVAIVNVNIAVCQVYDAVVEINAMGPDIGFVIRIACLVYFLCGGNRRGQVNIQAAAGDIECGVHQDKALGIGGDVDICVVLDGHGVA